MGTYSTYVPGVGNEDADIMFVGEAPGKHEARQKKPFVGRSGKLLTRYIRRLGFDRSDVFLTNLCKYRPKPSNNFKNLLGTDELEEGLTEVANEIRQVDPKIIVALGGWPTWYLTRQTGSTGKKGGGITQLRGSVYPCELVTGYKVMTTLHPAYVQRVWDTHPFFMRDLRVAKEEIDIEGLRRPEYESIIDPPEHRMIELVDEMTSADWLSVDIETFPDQSISCAGFADSENRALCITYQRTGGLQYIERLFSCPARKIFQYGTYDITFMRRFYNIETNGYYPSQGQGWDTYVAGATLYPEFPRGLDFLTSMYTHFPWYKEERKTWKEEGDMSILWEYNLKDVIATWIIAAKQQREMQEKFGVNMEHLIPLSEAA